MARTIPAGLAAYITAGAHSPALSITLQDALVVPKPTFMGANGSSPGRSHAIVTAAGTLLRAICTQAADPNYVAVQRITSPTTAAQWQASYASSGTTFGAIANARAGVCLTQRSSDNVIFCFYQRHADNLIAYRYSANDGVSWSAETTVPGFPSTISIGYYCYGICADTAAQLNLWAVWADYDPNGICEFCRIQNSGTAWGSWSAGEILNSSPLWGSMRGCSTADGTHQFLFGVQMREYLSGFSAATSYWTGSAYGTLTPFVPLDTPDIGLGIFYPSLTFDGNYYWYTIQTNDDGTLSGTAQTRTTVYGYNGAIGTWQVATFGNVFSYGAQCIDLAGFLYIFDAVSCYQIPFGAAVPGPTDVSDDVLEIRITDHADDPSVISLVLDNSSGTYNALPNLDTDGALTISLGYQGYSLVKTHVATIDQYTYQVAAARSLCIIQARTASRLLDYASQKYLALANQTVKQLCQQIALQAWNTPLSFPAATSQFSQTVACFVINPGETWLSALKRVGAIFGFTFFDDQTPQIVITERQGSDAPTWSYGNEILALSFGQSADQANWIRVIGSNSGSASASGSTTVFADWYDNTNLGKLGRHRFLQIVDRMLTTSAQCLLRAQLELNQEQRDALYAELAVALNPAHQINDVIQVTATDLGLNPQPLRITSIDWLISPETGTYEQRLLCSGV